jgi:hypothetical protein
MYFLYNVSSIKYDQSKRFEIQNNSKAFGSKKTKGLKKIANINYGRPYLRG